MRCHASRRSTFSIVMISATWLVATMATAATIQVPQDYPSIQPAIDAAADGDEIVVAPGTYHQTFDMKGKRVTLRSSAGPVATILDGDGLGDHIATCTSGEALDTVIRGFTFRNGRGAEEYSCTFHGPAGGAIAVYGSALTLENCIFEDNGVGGTAPPLAGGAIHVFSGDLQISHCVFRRNGDLGHPPSGGAIFLCGGSLEVVRSSFADNHGSTGGAICNLASSSTIEYSSFEGNHAGYGGGVSFDGTSLTSLTIDHSTFTSNSAGHGGGVMLHDPPYASITSSTFSGGEAAFGGGINASVGEGKHVVVADCTFADNLAGFGGGMFAYALGGSIEIESSRFTGNHVRACCNTGKFQDGCFEEGVTNGVYWGGGLDLRTEPGGEIRATSILVDGNDAIRGGGIATSICRGGTIQIVNATIAANQPSGVDGRAYWGGSIRLQNSIVWSNASDQILADTKNAEFDARQSDVTGGFPGVGNYDLDPLFVDLAAKDFHLAPLSPLIDAGENALLPAGTSHDVDGNPRFVDDPGAPDVGVGMAPLVDIGAFERQTGLRRPPEPPRDHARTDHDR